MSKMSIFVQHKRLTIHSNALAFVMRRLIGKVKNWQQNSLTSCIYVAFHWMVCSFMWLATLKFETIFKIIIWRGILPDIRLEITFYGATGASL